MKFVYNNFQYIIIKITFFYVNYKQHSDLVFKSEKERMFLIILITALHVKKIRSQKAHSSVILAFESDQEAKKAVRNRLIIAGTSVKTTAYKVSKPTDQCNKC